MTSKRSLDRMFMHAKKQHQESKTIQYAYEQEQAKISQETYEAELFARMQVTNRLDPATNHLSSELYELIQSFDFTIEAYEHHYSTTQSFDLPGNIETYYCAFGDWQFKVHNYKDVDIQEGIFSLTDIIHKETGEVVSFYCDLGCRNTSVAKRDELVAFLTYPSLAAYVQDVYAPYLLLPTWLREHGLSVIEHDYSFALNQPNGYLTIAEDVYVKVYRAFLDEFQVVVTNDPTWDVYSFNSSTQKEQAYYVAYYDQNDLDEVVACIRAFQTAQSGEIGFLEDGRYYTNDDVYAFYDKVKEQINMYEETQDNPFYHIHLDDQVALSFSSYQEQNGKTVNKYEGLELYVETALTFIPRFVREPSPKKNTSHITIEFDRRKSDLCHAVIQYFSYQDDYIVYDYENQEMVFDASKEIATWEAYGTFSQVMEEVNLYVYNMLRIHHIITE